MKRKRKKYKYPQVGKSNRFVDKHLKAKKVGWRKSKAGRKYFENRRNRSDRDRRKRL